MKINTFLNKKLNIKIRNNTIIIIILVALLIVLGVYWQSKRKSIIEGNSVFDAIKNKTLDNMSFINEAVGGTEGGDDIQKQIKGLMDDLEKVTKESEDLYNNDRPYAVDEDNNPANLINRTPETYPGKTFLLGGNNRFSDGFCETYGSKPDLDIQCNKLTAEHCNQTDCCVFLNGKKCVAGSKDGPDTTIDTVSGGDIDYTYYSHKNTCYGSCGDGMTTSANPCSIYKDDSSKISKECIKRYWKNTVCGKDENNPDYISDGLVTEWKDYSRKAIKAKIRDIATNEEEYNKCYGEDESNWPEPCIGTRPTSFGLSKRCMTHLFKETGCTYEGTISSAFVEENRLEPKSAMLNKFAGYFNGTDKESKQKCYGYDEIAWPDPCKDVTDNTPMKDVSEVCMTKTIQDHFGNICNNGIKEWSNKEKNYSYEFWSNPANNKTFKDLKDSLNSDFDVNIRHDYKFNPSNTILCYGSNPNNWTNLSGVDFEKVVPDPCEGVSYLNKRNNYNPTKVGTIPEECRSRLAGLIKSTTNISEDTVDLLKSQLANKNETKELGYYLGYISPLSTLVTTS